VEHKFNKDGRLIIKRPLSNKFAKLVETKEHQTSHQSKIKNTE
jgi:hypothetical protein